MAGVFSKLLKTLSFLIIRSICARDGAIRRVDVEAQTEILLLIMIGGAIK